MDLEKTKKLCAEATAGPWRWEVRRNQHAVSLCGGTPRFDWSVMEFVRWGMGGAAPRFIRAFPDGLKILERADFFAVPIEGREHHAHWLQALSHPDANFIAEARTALPEAVARIEELERENATLLEAIEKIVRSTSDTPRESVVGAAVLAAARVAELRGMTAAVAITVSQPEDGE